MPRHRIHLDHTAMISHDAGNKGKTQSTATTFARYEGIKDIVTDVGSDPRPVINHLNLNGNMQTRRSATIQPPPS